LQRGSKREGGKDKKRNKWNKSRCSKNKRDKNDVTEVLVFNILNVHPWIPKTFCPENLAIVDNNHPFKLT
jgi:hypothetical protein